MTRGTVRSDLWHRPVKRGLAFRELGRATCLVQTDLLALDLTGVAGHETGLAQRRLQRLIIFDQRAGDAQTDRAGLTGDAATGDRYLDVELAGAFGQFERLAHDHARGLATEKGLKRLAIDFDCAIALAQ